MFSPAGCELELRQQLTHSLDEILDRYRRYVLYIRGSVLKKELSLDSLVDHLLYLPALKYHSNEEKHKLLHGKREKLRNAKTIRALFLILDEECSSFLNYGVFRSIATEYGINEDCDELKYPEHLKAFFRNHTISELAGVIPRLGKRKRCDPTKTKVTCKLDIEKTKRFAEISELDIHVADILGLNVQSLELVDISDGCVEVTFLVTAHVADAIVARDHKFTSKQVKAMKIIWLKCGDKYLLEADRKTLSGKLLF